MTKEEVLQRANEYCSERSYDESTLTTEFKEKFADFFSKKNADGDINDEAILADLKFNLDTARSAALRGIASTNQSFEEKENDYKTRIADLEKKLGRKQTEFKVPKEVQDQLDELRAFKNTEAKKVKFASILNLAKEGIRQDLHKSFEVFAKDLDVDLTKEDKEQADSLVSKFQEIFMDSIGNIKPLSPQQTRQRDADAISSLKRIKA